LPTKEKMVFVNPYAGVNQDIPNIGLAYAATRFLTKVIDLNTLTRPKARYLDSGAGVLGISVQSRTWSQARQISQNYKLKYPQAVVKSVSGAVDIQCCYPYLDFKDKISFDQPFSDLYPFPDYELFDSFSLFRRNWQSGRWGYAIITSLGCPFGCSYCMSRQRSWRIRSVENCYQELKLAKEQWQIKSFVVIDDCFNVDPKRVVEFCRLIKPLGLRWACSNGLRADKFTKQMAQAMSEAGCVNISFGIESAEDSVLQAVEKGESIAQIEQAVNLAKRYFKNVGGFFIIGLPSSSYEKDRRSLNWALRKGIRAQFSYYVPFDQNMQHDALFYGRGAKPLSLAYSEQLQKRLYWQSALMLRVSKFLRWVVIGWFFFVFSVFYNNFIESLLSFNTAEDLNKLFALLDRLLGA